MGTKNNPGNFDCYANATPDEPMFILLARDKHAPTVILEWIRVREAEGEDPAKIQEAYDCIESMRHWRQRNR
jgi:hypothetical protein